MNNPMILASVKEDFYLNFIKDDRYLWLLDGLKTTLIITLFAVVVGLIIGFLVAIIRSAHDKSGSFKILNAICRVYLTVIRGTPTMIQLLIMNFVIFGSVSVNKIIVGGLAFGINSGAYVAEIVRSGIMSIDQGQTEAGRSLGLNFSQTMRLIIIPQAFKNVLPALVNEFIVLIKETSIIGYIGMMDLTKICRVYLTVIRGTPTMIQLLIMNFVIFGSVSVNKIIVGGLAFGINSGAYVAEIVRSGIMSIDQGQTEAGRSLGLNFSQTMRLIIIPQAFKNVLPALVNEFIVLIKETSIIGYIGMMDLTKGAMLIQSRTYNAFWPLMAAAAIYLVIVGILTWAMNKLERRLRTSER